MSRISRHFAVAAKNKKPTLIPYIAAGDPHPRETVALMHALVQAGADMIELGVPFSDPIADGRVIQRAYERALSHNVTLAMVLDMVNEFRQDDNDTPIILMGYQNPIEAMQLDHFAERAAQVGVDGVLTVDLPVEESAESHAALLAKEIDPIFLLSPTTVEERILKICAASRGFIYYVSLKGITGAGHLDTQNVVQHLSVIRRHTSLPISVGFGIKNAEDAVRIAAIADGVVIGSVLVEIIGNPELDATERQEKVSAMLLLIRQAMDTVEIDSRIDYGVV